MKNYSSEEFRAELRDAKRAIRIWIARWSLQKLVDVIAFNQDGKMIYNDCCRCLLGVDGSDVLHTHLECPEPHTVRAPKHFRVSEAKKVNGITGGAAEDAYHVLGESAKSCFFEEGAAQRRFGAILRAELRRREYQSRQAPQPVEQPAMECT